MDNYQNNTKKITTIMVIIIVGFLLFVSVSIYKSQDLLKNNASQGETEDRKSNEGSPVKENIVVEYSEKVEESVFHETEISTYTTKIYDNDKNRIHNINLACDKLNDYIIKSDTEFSFNNAIGPMGKDEGFLKSTGFDSKGKKIKIYGGGLCQISSTIYNTALIANFKITERHAHSRRVNYVPKDKDATILYGNLDLKFINNSGFDIKIKAYTDGHEVTISFNKIEQT